MTQEFETEEFTTEPLGWGFATGVVRTQMGHRMFIEQVSD